MEIMDKVNIGVLFDFSIVILMGFGLLLCLLEWAMRKKKRK